MRGPELERLRRAILIVLDANQTRFGLTLDALTLHVSTYFPLIQRQMLEPELNYLCDKGLIAEVEKKLSPENRQWKMTADGRDYLAQIES